MKQFASAKNLYKDNFVVPAFNIRFLTYQTARALFRSAKKRRKNSFIIELAQSEMIYTRQTAKSFAKDVLRAAKAENYQEPIYLQADHYKPVKDLEKQIKKALAVGFYNIDIDCSVLSLQENIVKTNYFVDFIKKNSPDGIIVSVGGEVGEIGSKNTAPDDLAMFLRCVKGINKVAVQTGTSHGKGGQIDWDLLAELAKIAKDNGLTGVVQHGASTLNESDLRKLKEHGVCEVHLATEIMNVIFQNPLFPFKIEKKEIGHFKKKIEKIPEKIQNELMLAVEEKFDFFLRLF